MAAKKSPNAGGAAKVSVVSTKKPRPRVPQWSELAPLQRQVIACVRRLGEATREQIGARLDWGPSAVSKVVSPLLADATLISTPPGARRRNARLSTAPELGFALGIELGFELVRASIVDFNGRLTGPKREYRPDRRSPEAFLACLQKVIRELLVQPVAAPILGIGIGYADRGAWNPAQAFADERSNKNGNAWAQALEEMFERPVLTRCDAACAALGEWRSGRLRGVENGLFLLYEDGIGLGIIASGQVVFGDANDAGEIGHLPIDDDGEYCHCGNIGCLETIAGKWALTKKAKWIFEGGGQVNFRRAAGKAPQFDELCAMAMAGDVLARNMLAKAGRALGRALAISASLFDPSVIVLGGCLTIPDTYTPLITATREEFQTLTAHRTPQPIGLEVSMLGADATLIGAAELVFARLLG